VTDGGESAEVEARKFLVMDKLEGSKRFGKFTLAPDKEIHGELTLLRAKTSLYLHDKDEFSTHAIPNRYIKGVLHDLTKVSLIECVTTSGPGHAARGGEEYHFASLFPHFVVYGDSHIAPNEKTIAKVHFAVDDATTLFYDFDAFGVLLDARPFIEEIAGANAKAVGRKIVTGRCEATGHLFPRSGELARAGTALARRATAVLKFFW
jgi:hypothetical protein